MFLTQNSFSQIKSGTISYKVVFDQEDMKDFDVYKEAQTASDRLNYTLKFNKEISVFYLEESINDDLAYKYASSFSGKNRIYQVLKDSSYSFNNPENSNFKKEEFIINEPIRSDWKLHSESKKIGEYLCYKATSNYQSGKDKKTFPIIAWYCPQIPYSFGPSGYGNLPGLILEIQIRNILFGATKINFDDEVKAIFKPSKGKVINYEQYNTIISERAEKHKESRKEQQFLKQKINIKVK